ncbi:MAG TPA: hypothetical protein VKW09_02220 [bacterium]|nr:hypothetical protein [bacterium]
MQDQIAHLTRSRLILDRYVRALRRVIDAEAAGSSPRALPPAERAGTIARPAVT